MKWIMGICFILGEHCKVQLLKKIWGTKRSVTPDLVIQYLLFHLDTAMQI